MRVRNAILQAYLDRPGGRETLCAIFWRRINRGASFKEVCEDLRLPWNKTCMELGIDSSHLQDAYYPPKENDHGCTI